MNSSSPLWIRTSERKDLRRCPWRWNLIWRHGWKPRRSPTWSVFGIAWHRAMQVWYPEGRRRGDIEEAIEVFLESLAGELRRVGVEPDDLDPDSKTETKLLRADELGPAMLRSYAEHFGNDSEWEVIHTEQPFQIDVPDLRGRVRVVYLGTWDLLAWNRDTRKFWLWDHKTCRAFPDVRALDLDDQAGSYVSVAREVLRHKGIFGKRDRIEGIIFNYAKKSPPDPRPRDKKGRCLNKNGSVSLRQPAPRFLRHPTHRSDYAQMRQFRRVRQEALMIDRMKARELPIIKNPAEDCPRCPMFDVCELHEQGDDWKTYLEAMFVKRDPYADHRLAMEEGGIQL